MQNRSMPAEGIHGEPLNPKPSLMVVVVATLVLMVMMMAVMVLLVMPVVAVVLLTFNECELDVAPLIFA